MSKNLKVGKIVNTHGLKGEVKVIPLTDDMRRFDDLDFVLKEGMAVIVSGRAAVYTANGTFQLYCNTIQQEGLGESCKYQKDRVIIKLEGVNKIEDAERLKEKFMEVTRENAVELEEDCYFLADLRECTVFDTTGKELGRIYDVIQTKNNDVYWIRKPKELLIPVLKDIVLDINIDERKIIIRPVGEWMDED